MNPFALKGKSALREEKAKKNRADGTRAVL
jgi:hypothetical protein